MNQSIELLWKFLLRALLSVRFFYPITQNGVRLTAVWKSLQSSRQDERNETRRIVRSAQ
jgi:hypothetical protein